MTLGSSDVTASDLRDLAHPAAVPPLRKTSGSCVIEKASAPTRSSPSLAHPGLFYTGKIGLAHCHTLSNNAIMQTSPFNTVQVAIYHGNVK